MEQDKIYYDYMDSPLGELEVSANFNGLLSVLFVKTKEHEIPRHDVTTNNITEEIKMQMKQYFNNDLQQFDIPLAINGTAFQTRVWKELCNVPYGKTISYLTLAKKLGDEKCIRAAASANGKNPLAVVVPCHRVIGSNGKLVGYAGDLWRKQWLLEHESSTKQTNLFS
jgi:methylated-DNA-[protein]-cysteine S-methyltransferase